MELVWVSRAVPNGTGATQGRLGARQAPNRLKRSCRCRRKGGGLGQTVWLVSSMLVCLVGRKD